MDTPIKLSQKLFHQIKIYCWADLQREVEKLKDENDSLWDLIEEEKASDIRNFKDQMLDVMEKIRVESHADKLLEKKPVVKA